MKRMNRKKIIETLELARSGYASIIISAKVANDNILVMCAQAHHLSLNRQIIELGGEDVPTPFIEENIFHKNKS